MITKEQLTEKQELALLYLAISSEAYGGIGGHKFLKNGEPCCAIGHLDYPNDDDIGLEGQLITMIHNRYGPWFITMNDRIVDASEKDRITFKEWCEGMGIEDSIYNIKGAE